MARKSRNAVAAEASQVTSSPINGGTPTGESKIPLVTGTVRRSRRKESANIPAAETTAVVPETNGKRTSARSRIKLQSIVEEPVPESKSAQKNPLESAKKNTKEDLPAKKPLESSKTEEPAQKPRRGRTPRSSVKEDTPDSSSVTENEDQQQKIKSTTAGRRGPTKKGLPPIPPVKGTTSTPESKTPQMSSTKKPGRASPKVDETSKQTKVSPALTKSSKSRASASAAPENAQTPVIALAKKDTVVPVRSSSRSRKIVVPVVSEEKPSPSVERPSTVTSKRNASAAKLPPATSKRARKDPVISSNDNTASDAMEVSSASKPVRRSRSSKPAEISSVQEESDLQTAIPNQDEQPALIPSTTQTRTRRTVSNRRSATKTTKDSQTSKDSEEYICSELKAPQTPQSVAVITSEPVLLSAKRTSAKPISTTGDILVESTEVARPSRNAARKKPVPRSTKLNNSNKVPEISPRADAVPDAKQDVQNEVESSISVLPKRANSRTQNGRKKTQGRNKALEPAFENTLDAKTLPGADVACGDMSSTLTVPVAAVTLAEIETGEKRVNETESTTASFDNAVTKKRRGRVPNAKKNLVKQKATVSESEIINDVPIVSENQAIEQTISHAFDLSINEQMALQQTQNQDMEIDSHDHQVMISHNDDMEILGSRQVSVNDTGTLDFECKENTHASKKRSMPENTHEAKRQKCSDDQISLDVSVIRRTPPRSAEPRPLPERESNRLTMSAMQIDWNADDITNSNDRLKHVGDDQIAALKKRALSFDALPVGFGLGISGWMTSSLLRQSIEENPDAENKMKMNTVDVSELSSLPVSYHNIPCLKSESEATVETENLCKVASMPHFSEEFKNKVKKQSVKVTKTSMHLPAVSPVCLSREPLDSEICKKIKSSPVATFILADKETKVEHCRKTKAKAAVPCKGKSTRSRKP